MKPFNLSEWLKDKSRKIITRQGKSVRIICTDRRHTDSWPIVALEDYGDGEFAIYANIDGRTDMCSENIHDLFFADEEKKLTEFEKKLKEVLYEHATTNTSSEEKARQYAPELLDLARKEILKEQEHCVVIPEDDYYKELASQYQKGRGDTMKSLPKWKKSDRNWITNICDLATIVRCDGGDHEDYDSVVASNRVDKDDYYIELEELLKLPKEE